MSDLIDRQAAIDFIDAGRLCNPNEPRWSDNEIVNFLKSRPSAQPDVPDTNVGDMINRQDVLALAKDVILINGAKHRCIDATQIHELPSAQPGRCEGCGNFNKTRLLISQPERKKGKWIKMSDADGVYWACNECGEDIPRVPHYDPQFDLFPRLESIEKTKFCPNCGADMRGEQNG